jgi:drug/metabolite transporter (DMT)-like permease
MTRDVFPVFSMALAMLLVGTTAPLGELALAGMPLFPVLALRLALSGAVLTVLGAVGAQGARKRAPLHDARKSGRRARSEQKRLSRRDWLSLALQAFCGVIVFNAGMWLGMRESSPAAAGIFTSATPAVMVVIGALAFGELPGMRALCGVCLTVAGVLAARGGAGGGWTPGLGDLLLLAAVAGESVFLLALKWLPGWLTPLDAARRITWIGLALTLPLAVWQGAGIDWSGVGISVWAAVAALGVLVTAGGYVLWFRGVARASASQAAAVTGLLPVSAVLSSWLLLGDAPTAGQALGCLAVGAGIWLASARG